MKLTKYDKDAFVRAVMQDVPSINYSEVVHKLVMTECVDNLHPKVKAVWNDKELCDNIQTHYFNCGSGIDSIYLPVSRFRASENLKSELGRLIQLALNQKEKRSALLAKVSSVINACSTLKQAKERLPEFEKYLPADRDGSTTTNLPVVANLVADLTKAGWSADKKKEVKK